MQRTWTKIYRSFIGKCLITLRNCVWTGYQADLILWNNENITNEDKSLFWKKWVKKGIYYIQDILNENRKFLTYEEFKCRYSLQVNSLHYFQILASIPVGLKTKASSEPRSAESSLEDDALAWKMQGLTPINIHSLFA